MEASETVRYIRARSGLSQLELSKLAGVAASTISRIERNELDPTWTTMNRIFDAVGCRPAAELVSDGDLSAIAAARKVLGELPGLELTARSEEWIRRWRRAQFVDHSGFVRKVEKVAVQAGIASRIFDRPIEQVAVIYDRPWQSIVADLHSGGIDYAVTGITATSPTRNRDGAAWPFIYVDDVTKAQNVAALRLAQVGEPRVTLLAFDGVSSAETVVDDGITWVSPGQALIDSYAGPGRMPDQADVAASRWQSELVAA